MVGRPTVDVYSTVKGNKQDRKTIREPLKGSQSKKFPRGLPRHSKTFEMSISNGHIGTEKWLHTLPHATLALKAY